MCGRFTVADEIYDIRLEVSAQLEQLFRPWHPQFNIAPSASPGHEQLIVVTDSSGVRAMKLARWWFIPTHWARPLAELPTSFNARSEQLHTSALWGPAFENQRCLVPASGWREFKAHNGRKLPFHFHLDHHPFAFAGLSSTWCAPDGSKVDTFAIITGEANASVRDIHDRMPLVVPRSHYDEWLSPADGRSALERICRYNEGLSVASYASHPIANDVKYEGPRTIERFEPPQLDVSPAQSAQCRLFPEAPEFTESNRKPRRRK